MSRSYLCIDLKSFYASVECVERGLDPMTTNLVVADPSRSEKTICLAITPAMKAQGVKNRCRVFEIPSNIEFIMAVPRMSLYVDYACRIYSIYLRYVSSEDIHVYSIDEAFLDVTEYLNTYGLSAKEMAVMLMDEIYKELGLRATAGVGSNLYLTKIALDITAKHAKDFIGVLDEESYKATLWEHKPITDFWMVGRGTAARLAAYGIYTMGDIARADEELIYKIFGKNAELLIDHAWGIEPVTIKEIKAYVPKTASFSNSQILPSDYKADDAGTVLKEMMELLCLKMTENEVVTDSITIYVRYAKIEQTKSVHGSFSLSRKTSMEEILIPRVAALYKEIVDKTKLVRQIGISCGRLEKFDKSEQVQLNLFDYINDSKENGTPGIGAIAGREKEEKQIKLQQAVNSIKNKYGKNMILKGTSFDTGATGRERNKQIGGHKA